MALLYLTTILLYIGIIFTATGICKDNSTMMVVGGIFVAIYNGIMCYTKRL